MSFAAVVLVALVAAPGPVVYAQSSQCENSDSWHVDAGLVDCVDDADWVKRNKPHGGRCDWVAKDPEGRCKKKSKDKVKASEACECACGSLGGTAAPTAEPGASFAGADSDLRVDQAHYAGVFGRERIDRRAPESK